MVDVSLPLALLEFLPPLPRPLSPFSPFSWPRPLGVQGLGDGVLLVRNLEPPCCQSCHVACGCQGTVGGGSVYVCAFSPQVSQKEDLLLTFFQQVSHHFSLAAILSVCCSSRIASSGSFESEWWFLRTSTALCIRCVGGAVWPVTKVRNSVRARVRDLLARRCELVSRLCLPTAGVMISAVNCECDEQEDGKEPLGPAGTISAMHSHAKR